MQYITACCCMRCEYARQCMQYCCCMRGSVCSTAASIRGSVCSTAVSMRGSVCSTAAVCEAVYAVHSCMRGSTLLMMTSESMLSKRPVLRFTAALFYLLKLLSSHIYCILKQFSRLSYMQKDRKQDHDDVIKRHTSS